MNYTQRREQLYKALAEQREIQRQATLMLDNARASEHQLLGGIAILDELLAGQKKENAPIEPIAAESAPVGAQA